MKLLAVSDEVVDRIYSLIPEGHFNGVSLVVACGDLPYQYLEDIVSLINLDLLYVPGNHDPAYRPHVPEGYAEGCTNVDLRTVRAKCLLIGGFGGSIRYKRNAANQYTQQEAFLRAAQLAPALLRNRLLYGRALDVLLTHSPPFGIQDDESEAHRGLKAINWIMRWAKPQVLLHGHLHQYRRNLQPDESQMGPTRILNIFPYRVVEIEDVH